MDQLKHFSHDHGLGFHHVPHESKVHCSGCKTPGSGNFYVCWQCSFFLHERCFRATRSLKHPSHPLHPLTLLPCPTYSSGSFLCNLCDLCGDGFSYSCSSCEFDIHLHCALMPPNPNPGVSPSSPLPAPNFSGQNLNSLPQIPIYPPHRATIPNSTTSPPESQPIPSVIEHFTHPHALKPIQLEQNNGKACSACEWELSSGTVYFCTESRCNFSLDKACFDSPREIHHRSHPQHPLALLSAPPNGRKFDCFACYRSGKSYVYTCPTCSYNLHIDCVDWRETMTRPDHVHPLTLYFSAAEATGRREVNLTCAVCEQSVNQKAWLYYCSQCGFGIHTSCMGDQMKAAQGANSILGRFSSLNF